MKPRVASVAFLLGSLSTGLTGLLLQPLLARLLAVLHRSIPPDSPEREVLRRAWAVLPLYLALELVLVAVLSYVVLYWVVGRPLDQTERAVEQLERLDLALPFTPNPGPLLSRVQSSLRRMADALSREQALTQKQLADLRRMNEQLSRAQTELVSAERLATVGRLAAGIAHEVGNPLSGILGYLSLARSRVRGQPELLELLDRVDHEVSRIDRIVRGLLDLGRPARGALLPVAVAPLAERSAELVGKGVEFERVKVELAVDPAAVASAEPGPLSQVLINLLLNAAQAMDGQGTIRVRGIRRDGEVAIEVEDSGPGIPPEVLPRLFEPFFTTKPAGKGTGLGLAVCLHLVSAMGGQLSAENVPGGGARFTVRLTAV